MLMDLKSACARYFLPSNHEYSSVPWFLAVFSSFHLYLQETKLFGRYLPDTKLKPFGAPSSPNEDKCIHICPSQHMDSVLSSFRKIL